MTVQDITIMCLMQTAREMKLDYTFVNKFIKLVKSKGIEISDVFREQNALPFTFAEYLSKASKRVLISGKCLEELSARKITVISTENSFYPPNLKKRLLEKTPPCFFAIGNVALASEPGISVTGVRDVLADDEKFAGRIGELCAKEDFVVVSGGAEGVDSIAISGALKVGGKAVVYLPQGFEKSAFVRKNRRFLDGGNLLCLSLCEPEVGFLGNNALERNIYIHSHGEITITVRAKHKSGGSWAGACYNLERGRTPAYVSDIPSPGNEALRKMGAGVINREKLFETGFSLKGKIEELQK